MLRTVTLCCLSLLAGAEVYAVITPTFPPTVKPIQISAPASTGLNGGVFVLPNSAGLRVSVQASKVSWQKFDESGAAYATPLNPSASEQGVSSVVLPGGDCGLVISADNQVTYLWIVDFSKHPFKLNGVDFAAEQDCDRTTLQLQGSGDKLVYYGINGNATELSRDIKIRYTTLKYNTETRSYEPETVVSTVPYIKSAAVDAPLCDTRFEVSGDRFTTAWGYPSSVTSELWQATAVSAESWAEQEQREVANEIKDQSGSLGGSAPCEIKFEAVTTDAAIFREWQLSSDPEFNDIQLRSNDLNFDYTFRESGRSYVRFVAADAQGRCTYTGQTFEVNIGESSLKCPNVFTPFSTPGVNDEWRVSYRSLISFDCHIYNIQGQEVFATTDPAQGWDGRYRGRKCPAGTYYYAIVAKGSDGKDYKLGGDINIVGGNAANSAGSADSGE